MDTKDMQETAVNGGIAFELPECEESTLRRPPKGEVEGNLVIHDPEEPLKSERVEEALKAMPAWDLTMEGTALTRVKELPTPEIAVLYTAYVAGYAAYLEFPVEVGVNCDTVMVTVYGPQGNHCMSGVTESMFELARQIG